MENNKEDKIEQMLVKIIYNWVKESFGESEANDPSWNIEALAHEIGKQRWHIYDQFNRDSVLEDMRYVAKEILDEDFTEDELELATEQYLYSDAYGQIDTESMTWFLHRAKGE